MRSGFEIIEDDLAIIIGDGDREPAVLVIGSTTQDDFPNSGHELHRLISETFGVFRLHHGLVGHCVVHVEKFAHRLILIRVVPALPFRLRGSFIRWACGGSEIGGGCFVAADDL